MQDFTYLSYAQEVVFAPGAVARLGETVKHFGWGHFMLCTTRSVRLAGHVSVLQEALGERLTQVYDHVQPHVQDGQVAEGLALAESGAFDAIIGMGGGSAIGMAKAVSAALNKQRRGDTGREALP